MKVAAPSNNNAVKFAIPAVPFGVGGCVYKLFYGDRYIIVKGKGLVNSLYWVEWGYNFHLTSGQTEGDKRKNKLYIQFYRYIQKHPGLPYRLEVLLESENGYQLLKREQEELTKAYGDKKNLNSNMQSYTPEWRPKLKSFGGYITKRNMRDFERYLKNS